MLLRCAWLVVLLVVVHGTALAQPLRGPSPAHLDRDPEPARPRRATTAPRRDRDDRAPRATSAASSRERSSRPRRADAARSDSRERRTSSSRASPRERRAATTRDRRASTRASRDERSERSSRRSRTSRDDARPSRESATRARRRAAPEPAPPPTPTPTPAAEPASAAVRAVRPVTVQPPLPGTPRPAVGTASPGCSASTALPALGVTAQTLVVNGTARTYVLSVPEGYDPRGRPVPLVFAFHGLTGTPTSLRGYLRLEREAAGSAIFVYPAGQRTASRRGRDVTRWDLRAEGADVAFFDALLAHLAGSHCVDLGRVYAVGHSAGAVVTNAIGCHRGNLLRAIAPIAGSGPSARRCTEPPAVWITHGRADDPVAFHYGEATRDRWVAAARCAPEPVPAPAADPGCVRYAGCAGEASVVFCPHDGDHGPPRFAPGAIWSFFTASASAPRP